MIRIPCSAHDTGPTLIALEATLTTSTGGYVISADGSAHDFHTPFSGGVFGAISWPRSRFQIVRGTVLEQQMFLPRDGTVAAFSWQLYSETALAARLSIRPLFAGCGPRSYRNFGFQLQPDEEGGRLAWLASVRGPKVIADTNGCYRSEPAIKEGRASDSLNQENLTAPGTFEFELSKRPSVLILTNEDYQKRGSSHIGTFLAGLLPSRGRLDVIPIQIDADDTSIKAV
jgi:hypothetical protein